MSKQAERVKRGILFGILSLVYTVPVKEYIWNSPYRYSHFLRLAIPILGATSLMYAVLCICYPGYVRIRSENLEFMSAAFNRYCSICMQPKPERAHHCSRCKKCVKKMDHHCHWLGVCANYDNLCHFIRFLFFSASSSAFIACFLAYYIYDMIFRSPQSWRGRTCLGALLFLLVSTGIVVITGLHLFGQIRMVINNITSIEICKKNSRFYAVDPYESPYDLGVWDNIKEVFGSPWLLFLGMPSGDGIHFKRIWDPSKNGNSQPAPIDDSVRMDV